VYGDPIDHNKKGGHEESALGDQEKSVPEADEDEEQGPGEGEELEQAVQQVETIHPPQIRRERPPERVPEHVPVPTETASCSDPSDPG